MADEGFVRQVEDALAGGEYIPHLEVEIGEIAPRVAAAIREAARSALRCGDTTFDSVAVAQQIELAIEADALRALRGSDA